jgi:hypothetical protein
MKVNVWLRLILCLLRMNTLPSKRRCIWGIGLLCLGWLTGGCGDGQSPTDASNHLDKIQIESPTLTATSSDLCALAVTLRNLTNTPLYPTLHFNGLRTNGTKAAFAVIEGVLAPNAVQRFEGILYPRTLATWDRPGSCSAVTFESDPASVVRFSPPSSAERGFENIAIELVENDQLSRMCRLNIVVRPRIAQQADIILTYTALDSVGNSIATALFAAILEDVSTPLFCTWTSPTTGRSLENCSDIDLVELNPSSIAF